MELDMRTEEINQRAKALKPDDAKIFLAYMSDDMLIAELNKRLYDRAVMLDDIGGILNGV